MKYLTSRLKAELLPSTTTKPGPAVFLECVPSPLAPLVWILCFYCFMYPKSFQNLASSITAGQDKLRSVQQRILESCAGKLQLFLHQHGELCGDSWALDELLLIGCHPRGRHLPGLAWNERCWTRRKFQFLLCYGWGGSLFQDESRVLASK